MLVITRKVGESFTIGTKEIPADGVIKVVILGGGNVVRIGVEADKVIPIHRDDMIKRDGGKHG